MSRLHRRSLLLITALVIAPNVAGATGGLVSAPWILGALPNAGTPPGEVATSASGGFYLVQGNSKLCLARRSNGIVVQDTCTDTASQRWRFQGSGAYRQIVNIASGKCLDIASASRRDGARLNEFPCGRQANQRFLPEYMSDNIYSLKALHSSKCIDVPGGTAQTGTRLQQYRCHSGPSQTWIEAASIADALALSQLTPSSVSVGGDAEYDVSPLRQEDLGWLRFLLQLLISLGQHSANLAFNGIYDGVFVVDGAGTGAVLELAHRDASLNGVALITERGLQVNLGALCPTVSVPVMELPINASVDIQARRITGHTSRSISLGPISGTVDVRYSFELAADLETLRGTINVDTPSVCADKVITGHFVRRPL